MSEDTRKAATRPGFLARASLRLKAPFLISVLLTVVLSASTWLGYHQLVKTLVAAARDRSTTVVQLLAGQMRQSAAQSMATLRANAASPTFTGFRDGRRGAKAELQDTLVATVRASRTVTSRELWSPTDGCVLGAWRPIPDSAGTDAPGTDVNEGCAPGFDAPAPALLRGPGGVGDLRFTSGRLYTEVSAVVGEEGGSPLYVVERRVASGRQGIELVSGLIAADARVLVGNPTTGLWSDFLRKVRGPGAGASAGPMEYKSPDGVARVAALATIPGTPWLLDVERDRARILAPASAFLTGSGVLAVMVLLLGIVAALGATGRVTRPLAQLTRVAEGMARGYYDRRAHIQRGDELGRLGEAFNAMAEEVGEARRVLEERVSERTSELWSTLEELKEAQEELVRKERLALLGELAGGVGHELRNPLGVMTNAIYYLEAVLNDAPPKVREYLGVLRAQVLASEKIVSDLLDFARLRKPDLGDVSLAELVDAVLEDVRIPAGVEVVRDFPAEVPPVSADRDQVRQILINLLTNAVQSMEEGTGTLTIRARPAGEGAAALEVQDTGIGIPPEDLEHIFQPLFTKKAKGIGLGLAVSRSLAEGNHGRLDVRSVAGSGSTFILTLPAHAAAGVSRSEEG